MAESDQISRKRMRFSSPLVLAATAQRSKSQINIQNNHASGTESSSSRAGNGFLADFRRCSSSLSKKIEMKSPRSYPHVTIKDLRLRRVSSPASVSDELDFRWIGQDQNKEKNKESPCGSQGLNFLEDRSKAIHGIGALRDDSGEVCPQTTPPLAEIFGSQTVVAEDGAHRIDQEASGFQGNEFSGLAEKKNHNHLRSTAVLNRCSRAQLFKTRGSFSYRRLLPYLLEVADDAASANQSLKLEKPFDRVHPCLNLHGVEENGKIGNAVGENLKEEGDFMAVKDQFAETKQAMQSGNTVPSACASPSNERIESSPNGISDQEQLSRRKLFRTPGSVNYRRLLPYFTNIQEDHPCVLRIGNHPETQESIRDTTLSISSVPEDEEVEKTTSTIVGDTQGNSHPVSETCEQVPEIPELSVPEKEQETEVKHVITDSEKNLEIAHEAQGLEVPLSSCASSTCSSDVATSVPDNASVDTLVEQINSDIEMRTSQLSEVKVEVENRSEEREANGLNPKALLLEVSGSVGTPPSNSPLKGILKRNVRGCRGLCNCLNCSSFRLHAERAFEFSRNQMQDTEEMVLDLVGEISYLRDILEKSSPANQTEICIGQVKEACRRASEAAEIAKSRLYQMNDDLQVHCRIPNEQRARVKFAHYIQEKTITRDHESDE